MYVQATPATTTPRLKYFIPLFFFLLLSACGDDERRGNRQEEPTPEQTKEQQKQLACESACANVYDTCEMAFSQSNNTTASREACLDACINQNFLRGNESCVASAPCDYAEFVECIRREPEPDPEPEPNNNTTGPPVIDCAEADAQWSLVWKTLEDDVLVLVNQARAEGARCGTENFGPAPPVKMESALRCAARLYSQDMATRGFFDHVSPEGTQPSDRIAAAKYTGSYPIGENIAAGQPDAEDVMNSWMNSPGHCTNIMNPEYRELGIGYYYSAAATPYRHFWTQNFGGGRP